jgi:hypothetical protein
VQADDATAAKQLVQLDQLDPLERLGERVGGEDGGAERLQDAGDDAADRPEPHQADRLPAQFAAGVLVGVVVPAPHSVTHLLVHGRQVPHRGQHQPDGELGGGLRVAPGSVGHGHAGRRRRVEVDVHRATAAHADQPEVRALVEHPGGERCHLGDSDLDSVKGADQVVDSSARLEDVLH